MNQNSGIPSANSMVWTTICAIRDLGGSGTIEEIAEQSVELLGLTEDQQSIPHPRGSRSEVEYRLAWARTHAKLLGLLSNTERGVWTLTELGQIADEPKVQELKRARARERARVRKAKRELKKIRAELSEDPVAADDPDVDTDIVDEPEDESSEQQDWKAHLLDVLKAMDPIGFERLTKRLLREAGFVNVSVTGGGGDGGIDGVGVYRMSLVSFPVYFQCKRYKDTVGSSKVRDFRGAMTGRGDKGLLITTGTFTADAKAEATRDGAPPVDLIDGDYLAELLREYSLGVASVERKVYDVTVDPQFFASI